ncbi:hypothetical protein ROG8370_01058 [Roseovarius gaetbuli]|uniref:Dihydroorotate dehydrogenase n=2 Tax=Roseovarius gaetbuli TaxID=1356575 RepID=A0A1X6YQJ0_9RHOB|nr:hypothetical protein ROG8370_01058 [Roseovarius gaetbuli]
MAMSDKDDMPGLEVFFDAARRHAAEPSAALMARIDEDAQAVQALAQRPAPQSTRRSTLSSQLYRLLGGWPAMTGLATAAVAGVWLGISLPEGILDGTSDAAYLVDVAPELAFDLAGGDF